LTAHTFLAVELDLAADTLQRGQPWIGGLFECSALGPQLLQQ
jgi:hypothetical protein